MKLLLDTHVFWWALSAPERLSSSVQEALANPANTLIISAAVFWELILKRAKGGLSFPDPSSFLPDAVRRLGAADVLPVTARHTFELDQLPPIHRDPFDRILVAQARVEHVTLVTFDETVQQYEVDLFPV